MMRHLGSGINIAMKDLEIRGAWFYHPLVLGNPNHAISKNILTVRLRFANQIDTLQNNLKKTPLLMSSMLTKKVGTPAIVELNSIANEPKEEEYSTGFQITGLLTEGVFNSMYTNRVKPFNVDNFRKKSLYNKMVVISDGDIGRNQLQKGKPFDLARDKWTCILVKITFILETIFNYFETIPSIHRSIILVGGITFFWLLDIKQIY